VLCVEIGLAGGRPLGRPRIVTSMASVDPRALRRIEAELERIGLLMQHDRVLPSVTSLFAGAPIAGSWWSHPCAHQIYDLLIAFEAGAGALSVKLVNGKVTFVHERLWPSLLAVVQQPRSRERAALSSRAAELLGLIERRGSLGGRELAGAQLGDAAEIKKALAELEAKVLIHVAVEHTATGAHGKVVQSWSEWGKAQGGSARSGVNDPNSLTRAHAQARLLAAAAALARGTSQRARLPWLDMPA
jgi:hypothetical protein